MEERVQEKPLACLTSSASVSDLSETLSDMSLSTSPGSSDVIAQELKSSSCERNMKSMHEAGTPPAPRRKRLVVRQMSSNPYLASAEMSPSDEHPLVANSHSYAAGESSAYRSFEAYSGREPIDLFSRSNSYPLTSDYVEETDEEESDEEEEEGSQAGDNVSHNGIECKKPPYSSLSSTERCNDSNLIGLDSSYPVNSNTSKSERNQLDVAQIYHPGCTKLSTPGESPTPQCLKGLDEHANDNNVRHGQGYKQMEQYNMSQSSGNNQCNRYYFHNEHPPHHRRHHYNHNSYQTYCQSELRQQTHCQKNNNTHFENQDHGKGFSKNKNNSYSNVQNSVPNESSIQNASATNSRSDSQEPKYQSRVMEVNAWGHFYRQQENHYKYRRSHYSSDSEDEAEPHFHSGSKSHHFKQTRTQTHHQHFKNSSQCCGRQQSPPHHRENVNKSLQTMQISSDKAGGSQGGVKPMEFKERFQTLKRWFSECNDSQKNLVLKGLLSICELPQLHLLSVLMSKELHHGCPSNCEDIITWLPADLATKVMSYLDPVSLCHASQVCKIWHQLADDQTLWRRFCCQTKWRLSRAAEHKQVISHMCQEGSIQWKNVFAERFRLRNNWLKGRCTVRTFEGHLQGISCVQFDDSRIVSGSSDNTIKVWNMRTNAPWSVQTLMGHHGTVRCLHLEGNRLVSGSCDTTIKVWDLSAQESWSSIACKVTMTGHTDTVRCLQADDDKVISGSYDKTLKIWDLKTGELRRTLKGHEASVLCVHFSETKIVSGSADKTIKLWNYEGSCMMTLCGHQDAVTCLMFDSTRVVSGSLDHNLKFWDIHSGQCLNTIDWKKAEGHTDVVRCLQADSWRVVSAADDKTIKVWNLETGERLVTLRNHTDGVTCLQFNDFIIVSGSYDKSVKLWDFSSC